MRFALSVLGAALLLAGCQNDSTAATADACSPLGMSKEELLTFRSEDFARDDVSPDAFALALVECLGDPDPELRDEVGYEGFATLLRGEKVGTETIRQLQATLTAMLAAPDAQGYQRPFAALVLAEIARTDRVNPWMSEAERESLVAAATDYIVSVEDYRGYDEDDGWRHGVAHGSDLLMQLTLNNAVAEDQLTRIRDAVASQIMPDDAHFYIYGEPGRLARPILFIAMRDVFSEDYWTAWFLEMASTAAPGEDFEFSQEFLASRHNLYAFASEIYLNASQTENEGLKKLIPGAMAALRATS